MDGKGIIRDIAVLVALAGLSVMLGWLFNFEPMKLGFPHPPAMRLTTAFSFLLAGGLLFFISSYKEGKLRMRYIILACGTILIIQLFPMLSSIFNITISPEGIFTKSAGQEEAGILPSIPTMLNFILAALAIMFITVWPSMKKGAFMGMGAFIALIGIAAIIGYALDLPMLMYVTSDANNGMAFATAALFVLLGSGFFLFGQETDKTPIFQITVKFTMMTGVTLLILVLLITQNYLSYIQSENQIKASVYNHMATTAEARADEVKMFLSDQKILTDVMSQASIFKDRLATGKSDPDYNATVMKAQQRMVDTIRANPNIYDNMLLDRTGTVVASSETREIGLDESENPYFTKGSRAVYISDAHNEDGRAMFAISAPVYSADKAFLGVYVAKIDMKMLNRITEQRDGLGNSGEVFLINDKGYILTPSIYAPDSVLKLRINTTNSRRCISELEAYKQGNDDPALKHSSYSGAENMGVFADYRGVPSLGTHSPLIPEENWCLIVKIDEHETLGVYREELVGSMIINMAILLCLGALLAYVISEAITKPIGNLKDKVDRITKGDLDIRLDRSNFTEIQNLIDSINGILASMKLAILRSGLTKEQIGIGELRAALREREETYRTIVNNAKEAITLLDPDKGFVSGNPAAIRMFGYRDEAEFVSKRPAELSPEYQPDGKSSAVKARELMDDTLKKGSNFFKWTHTRADGTDFPAEVLLTAITVKGKRILQATIYDLAGKETDARGKTRRKDKKD